MTQQTSNLTSDAPIKILWNCHLDRIFIKYCLAKCLFHPQPPRASVMTKLEYLTLVFAVSAVLWTAGDCVRCYQCSSDQDPKGEDNCGAYKTFDKERHIGIECNSEESHMPGSFCMKLTQQSPKGFIWDGRWRQVIRRCASVADTGVTGVCNWGVYENGVYWEECYCSEDECNSSSVVTSSWCLALGTLCLVLYHHLLF